VGRDAGRNVRDVAEPGEHSADLVTVERVAVAVGHDIDVGLEGVEVHAGGYREDDGACFVAFANDGERVVAAVVADVAAASRDQFGDSDTGVSQDQHDEVIDRLGLGGGEQCSGFVFGERSGVFGPGGFSFDEFAVGGGIGVGAFAGDRPAEE